ncbi:hypothetical protein D3C87_2156000 [compost metagenome]
MGQAFDADLVVFGLDRLGRLPVKRHEGRIIDPGLHQRLGKLHTGARIGTVGIHSVAAHAKTLAFA